MFRTTVNVFIYRDTNVHTVTYSIFLFFLSEAADVKIGEQEDTANEVVANVRENEEVAKLSDLDRWQGIGYVMPKKKSGLRHSLMKLFSSCFKANKQTN